ncbi:putative pyrroloquinoline quinone binding [Lyophyllum shimeji]|uniref:Pyrroloquinoline quinone binding n=1 Tax=Lyophyllum shimeji TaxID=47721 RepID=A0A9P3USU3_LYOSH|nr:putative pyrroloquinoline quinone binding [Lyophyllum shimeji]
MKLSSALVGLACLISLGTAQFQPIGVPFKSPVTVAPGFAAKVAFSNLTSPRGIAVDSQQNFLVVERGLGVTAFTRVTTPSVGFQRTVVIKDPSLTHGIQVDGRALYVSNGTAVLAYDYDATTKSVSTLPSYPYVAVDGLPGDGELTTHTILLEKNSAGVNTAFLVGTGPLTNIDPTARDPKSGRSQIRRLAIPPIAPPVFPPPPLHWAQGQVIAYGIRNPAGFAYDVGLTVDPGSTRTLWAVENGASINNVTGLTDRFANDNPSDELLQIEYSTTVTTLAPKSYGFPDCTSLWNPDADPTGVPKYVGFPRGTQVSLNLDKQFDDAWCQNTANNQPPSLNFQAHSVPLDIKFYTGPDPAGAIAESFPSNLSGHAFVSFHGSFDRVPPTGYGVVHVPFPLSAPSTSATPYEFLVQAADLKSCPGTCIRPVGLTFGKDGRLYVTSDLSGELFVLERSSVILQPN